MKKRAEITFETEETIVLRQGSKISTVFCPNCEELVLMATPQTIALLSGVTEREIFRLIETGEIHFIENDRVLVCIGSLNEFKGEISHEKDTPYISFEIGRVFDRHRRRNIYS